MRVGIVSDIHCNIAAFERAVREMGDNVDEILVAGDAIYEYRMSNEVVELIRDIGARYITGNHEMVFMGPYGETARSAPTVKQKNLDFLADIPERIDTVIGGKTLTMVHGVPWPPYSDYLYAKSRDLKRCAEVGSDFLILGHTHVPMVERVGSTLVINPGSIGESRTPGPERFVSYAVLDTDSEEVDVVLFSEAEQRQQGGK
jgi:putative phosphoesterase